MNQIQNTEGHQGGGMWFHSYISCAKKYRREGVWFHSEVYLEIEIQKGGCMISFWDISCANNYVIEGHNHIQYLKVWDKQNCLTGPNKFIKKDWNKEFDLELQITVESLSFVGANFCGLPKFYRFMGT